MEIAKQAYQTYDFDESEIFLLLCNLMEKLTGDCSEDMIRMILQYTKETSIINTGFGEYKTNGGLKTPSALAICRFRERNNHHKLRQEFSVVNSYSWRNAGKNFKEEVITEPSWRERTSVGDKHFNSYTFFKSREQEYMIMKKIFGNHFSPDEDFTDYVDWGGKKFSTISLNDYYDENSLVRQIETETYGILANGIYLGTLKAKRTKFKRTKRYELKPFDFICFALLERFYFLKKGLFTKDCGEGNFEYEKMYAKMRHGIANNKDILTILTSRFIKYRTKIQYFDTIRNLYLLEGYKLSDYDTYSTFKRRGLQAHIKRRNTEKEYENGIKIFYDWEGDKDEEPYSPSQMSIRKMLELINKDKWWNYTRLTWSKKEISDLMSKKNVLVNLKAFNRNCYSKSMKIPYVKSWKRERLWGALINEGHKETLLKLRKKFNKTLEVIEKFDMKSELRNSVLP